MEVPGAGELRWRVAPRATALKAAAAFAFTFAALFSIGDPARTFVAGLAAVVLAGYAVRDLIAPVRLTADHDGVSVISGFAGRRRLPWSRIERVRVDQRRRLGLRAQLVEIDAGESLHLFSTHDLDAPCADVAAQLSELRTRYRRRPASEVR